MGNFDLVVRAIQAEAQLSKADIAPTNYTYSACWKLQCKPLGGGCCRRSGNSMFLALLREWLASRESRESHGSHELALDDRFPILAGI